MKRLLLPKPKTLIRARYYATSTKNGSIVEMWGSWPSWSRITIACESGALLASRCLEQHEVEDMGKMARSYAQKWPSIIACVKYHIDQVSMVESQLGEDGLSRDFVRRLCTSIREKKQAIEFLLEHRRKLDQRAQYKKNR